MSSTDPFWRDAENREWQHLDRVLGLSRPRPAAAAPERPGRDEDWTASRDAFRWRPEAERRTRGRSR